MSPTGRPVSSSTHSITLSVKAGALYTQGMPWVKVTFTRTPKAWPTPAQMASMRCFIRARVSSETVRRVPTSWAVSGRTLAAEPLWNWPMVRVHCSKGGISRARRFSKA